MMDEHPHVPAAFINAIREEGTKAEAIDWLQKTWNERCALSARVAQLEEALRLADEWMCCDEPHLRDTAGFKRDREVIRAALSEKEARG